MCSLAAAFFLIVTTGSYSGLLPLMLLSGLLAAFLAVKYVTIARAAGAVRATVEILEGKL
jgi:hypothetical protein